MEKRPPFAHFYSKKAENLSKKNLGPKPGSRPSSAQIHEYYSFYGQKKQKPVLLAVGANSAFSQIFKMAYENLARGKNFDIFVAMVDHKTIREFLFEKMA